MGIFSEFSYGIGLYTFSFAFSNLNREFENQEKEIEIVNQSHNFLASISRELFNIRTKKVMAKKIIYSNWAFTCL